MRIKPPNLLYDLDDKPPLLIAVILGLQHICIIAIGLIFPVVIIRESGGTPDQASRLVAVSMLAGAIGVVVQALRKGPLGSGFLCPQVCGPSFLSSSILACKTGGLSLLFGMTAFAGVFEAFLSRVLRRLRFMFPTELTGLIVMMVGITVIKLAVRNYLGLVNDAHQPSGTVILVASLTLLVMVGLNVWSKGKARLFCVLIGMIVGYGASCLTGILGPADYAVIASADFFSFPLSRHPGWSLNFHLLIPALVAAICSTLKSVGDLTTCQKINDAGWKRPDMENISKGILADAAGAISAGLLGGVGQSTSSSNIGLSIATGATSRSIAWIIAGLLAVFALFPKVSAVFAVMPPAVIGATLIFALSFMVVAGIQIITSRMLDGRKTFVVGISMIFGISVDMVPGGYVGLHEWVQPIFSSSLSAATMLAVLLNLLFRIGIRQKADFSIEEKAVVSDEIFAFIQTQGARWGMRREVGQKAQTALIELIEALTQLGYRRQPIVGEASFTEESFDVRLSYVGDPVSFPERTPTREELVSEPEATAKLALYLAQHYTEKIRLQQRGETCDLFLHFDH